MGDDEAVATDSPFHIMNAVDRTSAKLRICASDWRVLDILDDRKDSMVGYPFGWEAKDSRLRGGGSSIPWREEMQFEI